MRRGCWLSAFPRPAGDCGASYSCPFAWASITSGTIYVNLAGYHVKAVRRALFDPAAGIFVTSLYGSAVGAGYLMGWIASHSSWVIAGETQLSVLSIIAGGLALALQPDKMAP